MYGQLRNLHGESSLIPFRQLGQYEDVETGLYYNRFRYYNPDSGLYISQDPIGLKGGNPNFYGYVFDSNSEVDIFGLAGMPWHHLIPQEMMKNPDFMKQLNQITKNANNYINRQGAFIEEGLHKAIHKGAGGGKWNEAFKQWAKDMDYDFTKKDIQNQLKKMMKDFNIPKSSRDFARKYKRKTKTKFKCKG
ncbi:RHS repeat domain-containing protein [Flavobacterium branchiophilum]|uniref:RHS repeat domain-containing protein n=1 Tax=Flavobacterium branchiophilum TaxID=55197 RepID=UPI0023EF44CF|nr:RHS repeat-associated core domain-containing protein [Flavobacterium branchiophilum]